MLIVDEKADSVEKSIEDQIITANDAVKKTANDVEQAGAAAVESTAVKVDNMKQEANAQADLLKAGATSAYEQGLKSVENAVDDQLRAAEKIVDQKIQSASKAVDDKYAEADKYADAKRQEVTGVSFQLIELLRSKIFNEFLFR